MGNEKTMDDWAEDVLSVLVLFVVVPSIMVGGIAAGIWWVLRDDEPRATPEVEWTETPAGWSQPEAGGR